MNLTEKQQIISQIVLLLERLIETQPLEMLTIKECADLVDGLS